MSLKNILLADEKVTFKLRLKDEQEGFKPFAAFFAHSGDSWFIEIALFVVWLFSRDEIHRLAALAAGAVLMLALLVLAIKFMIRRPRPQGEWGAIYRNTDPHSFPSGHAARVAMLSFLVFYSRMPVIGMALVFWCLLVCLARIWMGVHYLSDILAGVLLGILFGLLFCQFIPWFMQMIPWIFSNQSSLLSGIF
jgi:undecaprenyl-diphosphatase